MELDLTRLNSLAFIAPKKPSETQKGEGEYKTPINALSNGTDNSSTGGTWVPIGIYQNRRIYQCSECGRKIIASKSDHFY